MLIVHRRPDALANTNLSRAKMDRLCRSEVLQVKNEKVRPAPLQRRALPVIFCPTLLLFSRFSSISRSTIFFFLGVFAPLRLSVNLSYLTINRVSLFPHPKRLAFPYSSLYIKAVWPTFCMVLIKNPNLQLVCSSIVCRINWK